MVYFLAQTDMFGYVKAGQPLEKRDEVFECAGAEELLKTFEAIRRKVMQRQLIVDKLPPPPKKP